MAKETYKPTKVHYAKNISTNSGQLSAKLYELC